jgi:hypothetical protein
MSNCDKYITRGSKKYKKFSSQFLTIFSRHEFKVAGEGEFISCRIFCRFFPEFWIDSRLIKNFQPFLYTPTYLPTYVPFLCVFHRPTQGCQMVYSPTKNTIWVNFGRPWNEKGWHILWPFGIHYGHLVHFMAIW